MSEIDVNQLRNLTMQIEPSADLNSIYTFYYDETNNVRKFYVKEDSFNVHDFQSNFVLGGIVADELSLTNITDLFKGLHLQKNADELKLKHIAKGDFLSCLKSRKLNYFLRYLLESDLYIHYSSINILYYSLVDIVDSAIFTSEVRKHFGLDFANFLKDNLYKVAKMEIDSVVQLFYDFQYPNIKKDRIKDFIESLSYLFESYEDEFEFHVGLTSLKQILRESDRACSLPFLEDEEDFILLEDFYQFYMRPIYLFNKSTHVFDNEEVVESKLNSLIFKDDGNIIKPYSFQVSHDNLFIQASDVFVGLVGKLSKFINTNTHEEIKSSIHSLDKFQLQTLDLYIDLITKSHEKNYMFLLHVDAFEERRKLDFIYALRNKL